jgi:prephenate dehydrogenase
LLNYTNIDAEEEKMKIGIVGLGLIGGSIYKDLKTLGYDVIEGSAGCDIVFVCTPMNQTLKVLDELDVPPETIVADVCSLKKFVCDKPRPYRFVPTHPMAGDTSKGFENSREGMFNGAKWVVAEGREKSEEGRVIVEIIKQLGAQPVYMDAAEHDEAVALISHMPMVVSKALLSIADEKSRAIAGSGFRDMTRLAATNEEMAADMINMNAENIQTALLKLYNAIGTVLK